MNHTNLIFFLQPWEKLSRQFRTGTEARAMWWRYQASIMYWKLFWLFRIGMGSVGGARSGEEWVWWRHQWIISVKKIFELSSLSLWGPFPLEGVRWLSVRGWRAEKNWYVNVCKNIQKLSLWSTKTKCKRKVGTLPFLAFSTSYFRFSFLAYTS